MLTIHRSRIIAVLAAALVGCSGGGDSSTPTSTPTPVLTSISVSGGATVAAGATLTLVASPRDQNGNVISASINWSSAATNIATVNGSGVVTGVAPGTAVITATSGSVSTSTTVTVTAPLVVITIIVSGGTSVVAGATLQLTASPKDQNGNGIAATVAWSSSATSVASVSSNGLVSGVATGTAVVTASSGGVNGQVTVTVLAPVLTTIAISGAASVVAGSSTQFNASSTDQVGNAIAAAITWSSNATGIATVNGAGVVTGVAVGSAVITASSGSVSATKTISVTAVPPVLTTITIGGGSSVVAGSTLQLTASPRDQNGNAIAATITWSSGATGVATVNSAGLVTGVAAGSAVITAASGSVSATATITVTPAPALVLTTIAISGGTSVVAGSTLQLTASPRDQNGNPIAATITWASSTTGVATVNGNGLVTGVAAGTANITATSGAIVGTVSITVTAAPVFPATADVNATTSNTFSPPSVDIALFGTVNFIFAAVTHDVTFGSAGAPANIPAVASTTVSRTFNTAGTFAYQCTLHAGMTGTVIVH